MEQTFFPGASRRIVLGSPTLQSTSRRVCIPIRMPLTGESFTGMPTWISEAYTAVSRHLAEASPDVDQIADLLLTFNDSKPANMLFTAPDAKSSGAELKAFSVTRVGDPDEDPEVELQFKAYVPYARDFWMWAGEMAGKEVYMGFPSSLGAKVKAVAPDQAKLAEQPAEEKAKPDTKEYEEGVRKSMGVPKNGSTRLVRSDPPKGKKNGPAELRAYHAKQVAKEARPH